MPAGLNSSFLRKPLRCFAGTSSFLLKKAFHEGSAFLVQHTVAQGGFGMKGPGFFGHMKVAILFVGGAVHNAANLAPIQGACAHKAGLNGDVESGLGEVFAAQVIKG